jgi:predicted permease
VGRDFTEQDRDSSHKVAVVNESFARHYFAEPQQAIGHFYAKGGGDVKPDIEIVGVVRDAKHTGVREKITRTIFTPYLQEADPGAMTFYVRTWQSPESAEGTIRGAMQVLDSKLVLDNFRTMQEQIDDNLTAERVIAILASAFGLLAVVMAAVGLYGVLAYSTAQRTREIGIRIALGAARISVIRMVLVEVLWLVGVSMAIALPAAILLTSAARSQLYGISSSDPLTLVAVAVLVSVVAIASALLPARRAARTDPMVALRYE